VRVVLIKIRWMQEVAMQKSTTPTVLGERGKDVHTRRLLASQSVKTSILKAKKHQAFI
jgi:hypothetical protein